mmetsp:Transcript_103040/g.297992  ORF Transcript_103040/g.297992 Transcript_103040/m.297992 type:complete len:248 (-) Transcript_103040:348-1091(-)
MASRCSLSSSTARLAACNSRSARWRQEANSDVRRSSTACDCDSCIIRLRSRSATRWRSALVSVVRRASSAEATSNCVSADLASHTDASSLGAVATTWPTARAPSACPEDLTTTMRRLCTSRRPHSAASALRVATPRSASLARLRASTTSGRSGRSQSSGLAPACRAPDTVAASRRAAAPSSATCRSTSSDRARSASLHCCFRWKSLEASASRSWRSRSDVMLSSLPSWMSCSLLATMSAESAFGAQC